MTVADVVANVLAGDHGDFVPQGGAIVARELMEAEVFAEIGAGRGEVSAAKRIATATGRAAGRRGSARSSSRSRAPSFQARRTSPPSWSRAEPLRAGDRRRRLGGVRRRSFDAEGRPAGRAAGNQGMDHVSALCRALDGQVEAFAAGRSRATTRTCGWTPSRSRCVMAATSARRRW